MGNTLQKSPQIPHQLQLGEQSNQHSSKEDGNPEFTCEICIEPAPNLDKKFRNANKCSHPFCTDCAVKCPAVSCSHSLEAAACASLVGPELFVRWCDALCEKAILGTERCYCPYRNCNVLIVNECGESVRKSKCPSCKKLFCFDCKKVWHAGFGCEESGDSRDRNDVAFGRLVEQKKWMRCPCCRHFSNSLRAVGLSNVTHLIGVLGFGGFCFVLGASGASGCPVLILFVLRNIRPPLRWIYYRYKKWHYYLLDFCCYANTIFLVMLLFCPRNEKLFMVCFSFAEGPLAWALIVWRCSLVFNSVDKIVSVFIHLLPDCHR